MFSSNVHILCLVKKGAKHNGNRFVQRAENVKGQQTNVFIQSEPVGGAWYGSKPNQILGKTIVFHMELIMLIHLARCALFQPKNNCNQYVSHTFKIGWEL